MKAQINNKNIWNTILRIAIIAGLLLCIPLTAMQFSSNGVNWTASDFVAAFVLLFGAGVIYGLATYNIRSMRYRVMVGGVALAVLAFIWGELATGYF